MHSTYMQQRLELRSAERAPVGGMGQAEVAFFLNARLAALTRRAQR